MAHTCTIIYLKPEHCWQWHFRNAISVTETWIKRAAWQLQCSARCVEERSHLAKDSLKS